ncbi:lysophosphatidylcholine acyltransferase 3 protein nessy [Arctopsyche grandis]|uniref:lysophosphatidylcholine acyltransferase 3 protein nessy n=1 Tax=Arctopsyche grandis TaxID=121162 RepID=UPI00406D8047
MDKVLLFSPLKVCEWSCAGRSDGGRYGRGRGGFGHGWGSSSSRQSAGAAVSGWWWSVVGRSVTFGEMWHLLSVSGLASAVGATEPALRLMLSVLAAYPLAWLTHLLAPLRSPPLLLAYLTLSGLVIGVYNFGSDALHSMTAVLVCQCSIVLLGPGKSCALFNLVFHMTHLLLGYWATGTDTYDIKWTMPHCVLALRLIGLGFDLWDGTKPAGELSASNRATALRERPSALEVAALVYFPASYLVGPQFSLARLRAYVAGSFTDQPTNCVVAGFKRGLFGLAYLAFYQFGTQYFPDSYFLTDQFMTAGFVKKHVILGIWGKIVLAKYISCWLLTEGACITFGLAHNGIDKGEGTTKWDGCRNVRLQTYEFCTKFGQYIDSFNINTNMWVAQYVYKRVAFLGSRQISQGLTLLFLAVWHGFHSGYYMTFFMEFSIMLMERDLENMVDRSHILDGLLNNPLFIVIKFIILKLYVTIFMGYCLIPFTVLSFYKWWPVYQSLYFSGFVLFLPWLFLYKPILRLVLKPKKIETKTT